MRDYLLLIFAVHHHPVVVSCPMLTTGNSAIAVVSRLREANARDIKMLCLLATPEGIEAFHATHPDVAVYTVPVDERLDDHGYIVPGLGDAGDRLCGNK